MDELSNKNHLSRKHYPCVDIKERPTNKKNKIFDEYEIKSVN